MDSDFSVGEIIHLHRRRAGLSQGDLAEKAGISISYLSLIESDKRSPTLRVFQDIMTALNLRVRFELKGQA